MRPSKCQVAVYVLFMLLLALSWLLALGGIGRLSQLCLDVNGGDLNACQQEYRYAFYIIFLQLIIFVGLIVALARPSGVPTYRMVLVAFLVIVATQTMQQADVYLTTWNLCGDAGGNCSKDYLTASSAAAAGFVLLTIIDFTWIIICGAMEDPSSLSGRGRSSSSARGYNDGDKPENTMGAEPVTGHA